MSNITGPSGEPLRRFYAYIGDRREEVFAENKREARQRAESLAAQLGKTLREIHES